MAARRLTNRELAIRCRVSEGSLSRAINGYSNVPPALRRRIGALLELPEEQLFHPRDHAPHEAA